MKKEWISGKKGEKFNRVKSVDYLCEEMNDIVARYPGFRMVNFGDAALNMDSRLGAGVRREVARSASGCRSRATSTSTTSTRTTSSR
jgi:hypothetical protein